MNFNLGAMKRIAFVLILAAVFWWWRQENPPPENTQSAPPPLSQIPRKETPSEVPAPPKPVSVAETAPPPRAPVITEKEAPKPQKGKTVVPYVLDNGLVVVHGDVVLGRPADENAPEEGLVELPPVRPWKSREIAFHIQSNLSNPERVLEAIELFSATALRFVPYTDQTDVLVFEESTGVCKSYVGSVGGKQPVWLPRDCGPAEVAHEIMHALGFVHEQNRLDRDAAISVNFDNIEEKHRANFEILPAPFMALNGLAPFDFESLMIYPDNMFAKSSRPTMEPRTKDRKIAPGRTLSPSDIERINEYYARLP